MLLPPIKEIDRAERIILPGVGAFGAAMSKLEQLHLVGSLINSAKSGKPFLGICLGMQMLLSESEEFGQHRGLELIMEKLLVFPKPQQMVFYSKNSANWLE